MSNSNKPKASMQKTTKPTLSLPILQIRGIEASKLISSQDYQRPVNQKNVKLIKDGYVKELVNPVKVSLRSGKYFVFDGQHTLTVLTEMFGDRCIIPCLVYTGMSYEREAELFAKQDIFKRKLNSREQYKGLYEAQDDDITNFVNVCKKAGFSVDFTGGRSMPSKIQNVKYMYETVYKKRGAEHLTRLLSIIKGAYPDEVGGVSDPIVKGLDVFITLYDGEFSDEYLVSCLKRVSPVVITRNGKADMTHVGATRFAIQIFDIYNKGRKTRAKLRSKF